MVVQLKAAYDRRGLSQRYPAALDTINRFLEEAEHIM